MPKVTSYTLTNNKYAVEVAAPKKGATPIYKWAIVTGAPKR